jgi:hypothetical protein
VIQGGGECVACFEEEYESLKVSEYPTDFLKCGYYPDRFMGDLSFSDRRIVLGKLISFWKEAIIKYKITACVHETISYEPEEVLSLVCKETGCLDMNFLATPVNGYFFWKPDPYSSSISQKIFDDLVIKEKNLEIAKKYVADMQSKSNRPFYLDRDLVNSYSKRSMRETFKDLVEGVCGLLSGRQTHSELHFKKKVFYFNDYDQSDHNPLDRLINDYYSRTGKYDDVSKLDLEKCLLFPLHYEPEATLYYFSPEFSEQIYVVQQILKFLPLDCCLLVKEHPNQQGRLLTNEYQRLKNRNSNVYFVKSEEDTYNLVKSSKAVITITGSTGWEALILGKPVFVFGNVYYDKHPSVMKLEKYANIASWFKTGLKKAAKTELSIEYLAKILSLAYPGYYSWPHRNTDGNYNVFKESLIQGIKKCINRENNYDSKDF